MTLENRPSELRRNHKPAAEFNPAVNHTRAASESIRSSRPRTNGRRVGTLVLLLVCAGIIWFLTPNRALPPVVTVLSPDYSVSAPPLPLPDRWIPMKWGWLWRLRYAVLGKPTTVDIETRLMVFRELRPRQLQQLLNERAPLVSSNGVRAWIVPETEIKSLGLRLDLQANEQRSARMSLGFGVLATMSMTGPSPIQGIQGTVGDTITYAARKRGDSIELAGTFTSTEVVTNAHFRAPDPREVISLHTNLTLAARIQIPRGQSVFLYDTNRVLTENSGIGLLIRPTVK